MNNQGIFLSFEEFTKVEHINEYGYCSMCNEETNKRLINRKDLYACTSLCLWDLWESELDGRCE